MTTLSLDLTVAELVLERPARSRVFEQLGIDYCCGGKKTLRQVCEKKQLDPEQLSALLEHTPAGGEAVDLSQVSLSALITDIVRNHHEWLRTELPRIDRMLTKVARVHGDEEPRLHQMLQIFQGFAAELGRHMMKEERILFPAIESLESLGHLGPVCFQSIAQPISQMEAEHDEAGDAMEQLSALSDRYTPPAWACNTYRAMLDGLLELEQNMHQHVHKENNVLFPRAIALEGRVGNEQ